MYLKTMVDLNSTVVAVGDGDNDIGMFHAADISISLN